LKRIVFMDPGIFNGLEVLAAPEPDPELVSNVNTALEQLEPALQEILKLKYYEGATTGEIALALDKPEKEIISLIYEAKRQMRFHLAEFVNKRWGIKSGRLCRICIHPRRAAIESILIGKSQSESWGKITDRIYEAGEERFHPPQILKAHLKHMNHIKDRKNER